MTDQQPQATEIKEAKTSRRGLERHKKNPFMDETTTKTRMRKIASARGDHLMIVNGDTGEYHGPAGFWQAQEVDKTQFVKLYVNGVRAFKELTAAGTRVFELLYFQLQENPGKDKIHLTYQIVAQEITPVSEATFYRGMKELMQKKFIAESMVMGVFFVNPDYLWNGDRLAFIKEYRLRLTKNNERDLLTGDLFEALPERLTNGRDSSE